jgi:hypothetical protein
MATVNRFPAMGESTHRGYRPPRNWGQDDDRGDRPPLDPFRAANRGCRPPREYEREYSGKRSTASNSGGGVLRVAVNRLDEHRRHSFQAVNRLDDHR